MKIVYYKFYRFFRFVNIQLRKIRKICFSKAEVSIVFFRRNKRQFNCDISSVEPCSFPAGWRVPKLWWYLTGQTGQVVYVEEFGVKEMRRRSIVTDSNSGGGTIATIGSLLCL